MKELYLKYRKTYPPELSFLIDLLKSEDSQNQENLSINENELLKLISRHKLIGYIYNTLSAKVSVESKRRLKNQYEQHSRHTLKFVRQLILVSQKLDEWNLPYIAFKGPVLSQMLYGDPLVKHSVDLDF